MALGGISEASRTSIILAAGQVTDASGCRRRMVKIVQSRPDRFRNGNDGSIASVVRGMACHVPPVEPRKSAPKMRIGGFHGAKNV